MEGLKSGGKIAIYIYLHTPNSITKVTIMVLSLHLFSIFSPLCLSGEGDER